MAEDPVFRHLVLKHPVKGFDVVDALSGINRLVENILVDVRYDGPIMGKARFSRENFRKSAAVLIGDMISYRGLYDDVALLHLLIGGIQNRLIQRMIDQPDQLRGIVAQQIGIRIQRDHIPEGGQELPVAVNGGKGGILLCRPV